MVNYIPEMSSGETDVLAGRDSQAAVAQQHFYSSVKMRKAGSRSARLLDSHPVSNMTGM